MGKGSREGREKTWKGRRKSEEEVNVCLINYMKKKVIYVKTAAF